MNKFINILTFKGDLVKVNPLNIDMVHIKRDKDKAASIRIFNASQEIVDLNYDEKNEDQMVYFHSNVKEIDEKL